MIDLPPDDTAKSSSPPPANTRGHKPRAKKSNASTGLKSEIDHFVRHVSSLNDTLPLAMLAIRAGSKRADEKYQDFIRDHCEVETKAEGQMIRFKAELQEEFNRLRNRHERGRLAFLVVPRSLVVALVSQFDAFLGSLIRIYYAIHPEALTSSERNVTLAQLESFGSIDAAKEFILEKEVESVLRMSHGEQFEWMENRFGLPLRKGLENWPAFIELTERRNLFVHTSGIVSSQYLTVCKKHSVQCEMGVKPGTRLGVDPAYFAKAFECVFEIGVKLSHVFWRKMLPKDRTDADLHLNAVTYELLGDGEYKLAKELLDFACITLKTYSSEQSRRIFVVNRAQAYKWLGVADEARKIMDAEDWTASSDDFRMADLVLRDKFEDAGELMRKIGGSGDVSRMDYANWPLFREFRKSNEFADAFREVFGEPFDGIANASKGGIDSEEGPATNTLNVDQTEARSDDAGQSSASAVE